jgi:hypothetical protein
MVPIPLCLARVDQGIRRRAPFSGRLLSGQNEATGTRARELHQPRRDMLAAPSLGIDQGAHRLNQGRRLHGTLAVVHMPSVERLDDLTTVRIIGFDGVNPLGRIATPSAGGGVLRGPYAVDCARRAWITRDENSNNNLVIHGIARY